MDVNFIETNPTPVKAVLAEMGCSMPTGAAPGAAEPAKSHAENSRRFGISRAGRKAQVANRD